MKAFFQQWKQDPITSTEYSGVVYRDGKTYCLSCFQKRFSPLILKQLMRRFSPMLISKNGAIDRLYPQQYRCCACQQTLPDLPDVVFVCAVCARAAHPYYMIEGYNEDVGSLTFIPLCQRCENVRRLSHVRNERTRAI